LTHFGEFHHLIELFIDLGAFHAKDGAIHVDIFATGELGVKTGSYFEERPHPSAHGDGTFRRFGDAREDFQQSAFARTVPPYNPKYFALFYIERDISQCPDKVLVSPPVRFSNHCFRQPHRRVESVYQDIAQHVVAKFRFCCTDLVAFAEVFYADSNGH
jgi:hypothetical protein